MCVMTRIEKIDHICRSFPTWPKWVQKAALHAIGTHIGPMPPATTIKEALEKMDDDAVDEFYSDVEDNGDLIPGTTKTMEHAEEYKQGHAPCHCGEFTHIFRQCAMQRLPRDYSGEMCPRCNLWMCRVDKLAPVGDA